MDDRIHDWLFRLGEICLADEPLASEIRAEPEELEHGHDWMVALLKISQFLKLGSCHLFVFEVANLG